MNFLHITLVRPHLEYGNIIWSPSLQSHKTELENIYRRAAKMKPELKNMSCDEWMEFLKLASLAYKRLRGDAIEMSKYTHNMYHVATTPCNLDEDTSRRNNSFKIIKKAHSSS